MSQWQGKTRGNLLGYRIFLLSIKWFGLSVAYYLLKVVSFYFYLFAGDPKKYILNFYKDGMGYDENKAKKLTRKNFYLLGQTLIDRVAFLQNSESKFQYDFDGRHYLLELDSLNKGGILISAHLGNWEVAGNILKEMKNPIYVVMFDAEHEKIKKFIQQNTGGPTYHIIPIRNDFSHIFKIQSALDQGGFVCIHGDRYLPGARTIKLNFLNKQALFPYGPFHLASKFNAPVSFVFCLKAEDYLYKLSATKPMQGGLSPEEYVKSFVCILEKKLKEYPEQWFNYFDFFNIDEQRN